MSGQKPAADEKHDLVGAAHADNEHLNGALRIDESKAYHHLALSWKESKKWRVLICVFIAQISMNFNASVYGNAVPGMKEEFGIDNKTAKIGQWLFLILYGIGCELWAPFSEEFGRKPIMQVSLWLVNLFQIPCMLATNATTVFIGRALGGLSSAGGSVTLGICADLYLPQDQQYGVAFVVLASVGGSVVGPIVGGFITEFAPSWRWVFYVQLIFGAFTAVIHYLCCPETDPGVVLAEKAKLRRQGLLTKKSFFSKQQSQQVGPVDIYGPREKMPGRFAPKKMLQLMYRPYWMLLTEPIVLALSLLSGFSDALIFSFLDSYGVVFKQWNFNYWQLGLCFVPLLIGYVHAYFSFFPFYKKQRAVMKKDGPEALCPEQRLYWLLWLAPLEAIGLFAFGALSLGPSRGIPWIAPLLVSTFVGIANYAIYLATIDYMVAAYGHYSASATGGNGFSRDVLAGIAALYTGPFYENLPPPYSTQKPTWIFGCLAVVVIIPLYFFYTYGEWFRERSVFAREINEKRKEVIRQRAEEENATGPKEEQDTEKGEAMLVRIQPKATAQISTKDVRKESTESSTPIMARRETTNSSSTKSSQAFEQESE